MMRFKKFDPGARAAAVCLMSLLAVSLVGCGEKTDAVSDTEQGSRIELTNEENADEKLVFALGDAVALSDTTLPDMIVDLSDAEDAELNFAAVCGADYGRVESYYHSYAKDGSAEEITIICVRDTMDVVSVMESLQDHVETRRGTMREYDPEQVELLDHAILTYQDRYIGLFVSEKNGICKNTFEEVLEQYGI